MIPIPKEFIDGFIDAVRSFYCQGNSSRFPYLDVMNGYAKAINKASHNNLPETAIGDFLSGLHRLNKSACNDDFYTALRSVNVVVTED